MKTIVQLFFGYAPIGTEGGMEKVFVELSNLAVEKNYKVISICNSNNADEKPFFPLDEKVEFHNLGLGKIKVPFYKKIIREIAKIFHLNIENYVDSHRAKILAKHVDNILKDRDIYAVICYEINSVLVANVMENKAPKIAMAHGYVEVVIKPLSKWQLEEINKMNAYQVLMPNFISEAKKYLDAKIVYIPNIVPLVNYSSVIKRQDDKKIIINIGRIEPQKQQDILVKAFAKIANKDNWKMYFYGVVQDVKYKEEMERFIKYNNLSDKIFFKGVTSKPLEQMQNADIFAFPSAHEGFPLALSEAMSVGLPSIGFKNAHGINGLIKNGENGFLCKDINDFTDKLEVLMKNEELRNKMGVNACKGMKQYSSDRVWKMWEELFENLSIN
ncbi:MAG: glycosyltransferase [Campylobacteraceae bacterium]|nr:glycosyltransferase [Campylobacteraceae bacterium]